MIGLLPNEKLESVNGGKNYMNEKTSALKKDFESACRRKNFSALFEMLSELQARGEYSWARETAHSYGINSI